MVTTMEQFENRLLVYWMERSDLSIYGRWPDD